MDCIQFGQPIHNPAGLPHYPNPGLEDTLLRFLDWVRPLVDDTQWTRAKAQVEDFLAMDAFPSIRAMMDGLALRPEDSYIFDYWVRGHLDTRDPICPYTSVPLIYENPTIRACSVPQKAAAMLWALSAVYSRFRREGNGAYQIGKKTYSNDELFGALASINHVARGRDTMYISNHVSRHCLVLKGNRIYRVETITEDLTPLPCGVILRAVEDILSCGAEPLAVNLNTVTAESDRDVAGDLLAQLLENRQNAVEYQEVKDAIAVVALDECAPVDTVDRLYCTCWDPGRFNRFLGKGTQFSIAANGRMGMIVDHTYCDGGIEAYLSKRVSDELFNLSYVPTADAAPWRELIFDLTGAEHDLRSCLAHCREHMDAFTARVVEFPTLTRETLQERGILSGDGFLHIAFQVAQYLTWGEVRNTYISVDCRKFFRGRTEVNRPVTEQSVAFVKALTAQTDGGLRPLLNAALEAHYTRTRLAQEGLGVNRYLFVLEEVCRDCAAELGLEHPPALFSDPAYRIMGENKLSTTTFGHEDMKASYFPPVMPGGLGIFYQVGRQSFVVDTAFCCDETVLDQFNRHLVWAVDRMLDL